MLNVPYWLSVDAIDDVSDHMDAFGKVHKAFVDCLRDEQVKLGAETKIELASSIEEAWESYACWFYRCLTSINAMPCCIEDHLYEKFGVNLSIDQEKRWAQTMSLFWSFDSKKFIEQKLQDKAKYNRDMERHFKEQVDRAVDDAHVSACAGA